MVKKNKHKTILENSKQALNPTFNELVTMFCNDYGINLSKSELIFLKRAYDINVISNQYWSRFDFPYMSQGNFRLMTCRLKQLIVKVNTSKPPLYKLKGVYFDESVTKKYREPNQNRMHPNFEQILRELKHQPPQLHDIRLQTRTSGLYEKLLLQPDLTPNSNNKAFTISIPIDTRFTTKASIYKTNKLFLHIGCTQNPIDYSLTGFNELIFHLGHVVTYLSLRANSKFLYEPIGNWLIAYYHFNRDGMIIDSPMHSYTITDLQNHSVFYLKKFNDGTIRPRYEEHKTPTRTINQEMMLIDR